MTAGRIGRYEIKGELSHSGFASVWHGYDPRFKRDVAIKVLSRIAGDQPDLRARFAAAAEIGAALEHPAIVPVYDTGEDDGRPYVVMRLMSGGSLARRLARGPLSSDDAAQIFARIAPALDDARARGVVHGDLKPGNILFDQRGDAYVSDFGLAAPDGPPYTGHAADWPATLSPEQRAGEPIDARTDVYALGVILFEMLTGSAFPPGGLSAEAGEANGRLLPGYRRIIERATDGDPQRRFACAGDLDAALAVEAYQADSESAQSESPATPAEQLAQLRSDIARLALETASAAVVASNHSAVVPPPSAVAANPTTAPESSAQPETSADTDGSPSFSTGDQGQADSGTPQPDTSDEAQDQFELERQRKLTSLVLQLTSAEARARWLDVLQIGEELLRLDGQLPTARASTSRAYKFRGTMYHYQRDFLLAIADFTRGLELQPQDSELYYKRALSHQGRQRPDDALEDFARAIELSPAQAIYYAGRAAFYLSADDFAHALDDITRAIDLQPWDARLYAQRGVAALRQFGVRRIAFAQQGLDRAEADLTRAIQLDTRNSSYFAQRCAAYQLKGQTERAQADIARAIELDPEVGAYHYTLGALLRSHGNDAAALRSFRRAADLGDPNGQREVGPRAPGKKVAHKPADAPEQPATPRMGLHMLFSIVIGSLGLIFGISVTYFCLSPLFASRGSDSLDSLRLAGLLFGIIVTLQSAWALWTALDAQQRTA